MAVAVAMAFAVAGCGVSLDLPTPVETDAPTAFPQRTTAAEPTLEPTLEPIEQPTPPPAHQTPAPTPRSSVGAALERLLDAERSTTGAPGVLVDLRRDGRETFASSGAADLDGTPITSATRFRIASITKSVTATLVLEEVAAGKLRLDDTVGPLIPPGLLRSDPPVTIRQILSHTSGVFDEINQPDIFADISLLMDPNLAAEVQGVEAQWRADERTILPDEFIVAMSEAHDRYFAPGTGYHYSNTNYQLAGLVLAQESGETMSQLMEQRVAGPLGLRHTSFLPPETTSPELRGYVHSATDSSLIDVTDDLLIFGNGAPGGLIMSAPDLLATMRAIVTGKLAPPALVKQMERPIRDGYGLGLGTYTLSCGTFYGHDGFTNGTGSVALVSPDGSEGVVIALDIRATNDPKLDDLADQLLCGKL
jgi:D-alanyl-D-alanine carboxypeptidase